MAGFRYKLGDRPLDGYTIQHGAGRGGFGEVYYALSDSGREVALKVINGFEQIELRGVSQCMNLKSPHLVTIFDVRHNLEGVPFVIMEFVAGPSLRQIIDESPGGVGSQKAAFFLREMGKGLAFLHDCGIVHRDLKPGNIFYENGYVKIGDYGLSKAISTTQHSAQTITVGTVHYMAPEIGAGRYDKTIDIYALGAVLFEMLTGQVPYLGASPGEILMKHMTGEPDLRNIEEPFATVIRKAMARNPDDRYQNVQEMIEAVFGAEHVRQSVSCFSPESLSMVAGRVAAHVGGGSSGPTPARGVVPPPLPRDSDLFARLDHVAGRTGEFLDRATDRLSELSDRMVDAGARLIPGAAGRLQAGEALAVADPIPARQRKLLGIAAAAIAGVGAGLLTDRRIGTIYLEPMGMMVFGLTLTLGATGGIIVAHKRISRIVAQESPFLGRLAFGAIAVVFTMLLSLPVFLAAPGRVQEAMASTWAAVILPMFLLSTWKYADPSRPQRVALGPALLAGFCGLILAGMFDGLMSIAIGALAGSCLAVQAAMPWAHGAAERTDRPARAPRRPRAAFSEAETVAVPTASMAGVAAGASTAGPHVSRYTLSLPQVPQAARWGWMLAVPLLLSGGIMLLAGVGMDAIRRPEEQALALGFGFGLLALAVFSFVRSFRTGYNGWWPYIVRPIALYACVQSGLISAFYLGLVNHRNEEMMLALFFLILPIAMLPVLLVLRTRPPVVRSMVWSAPVPPAAVPPMTMPDAGPEMATMPMTPACEAQPLMPAATPSRVYAPPAESLTDAAGVFSWLLAAPGWLLLAPALGLALLAAVDAPGFVAAGLLDPHMAQNMSREFGFARWPSFVKSWMNIVAHAGLFFSAMLLIFARRGNGAAHMVRVVIATAVFALAAAMLDASMRGTWIGVTDIAGRISVPASIEQYMEQSSRTGAVMSLLTFAVGLVVLAWPGKARKTAAAPASAQEVAI